MKQAKRLNQTSLFTTFLHIRNFNWEANSGFRELLCFRGFGVGHSSFVQISESYALYLDSIQHFRHRCVQSAMYSSSGCCWAWGKSYFFLATTHSIFQFEEVNSKDEISSPQLLYSDSLEIQVDESSMHIFGLRISEDISIAKHWITTLQLEGLFYDHFTNGNIMLLASQTLTTFSFLEVKLKRVSLSVTVPRLWCQMLATLQTQTQTPCLGLSL